MMPRPDDKNHTYSSPTIQRIMPNADSVIQDSSFPCLCGCKSNSGLRRNGIREQDIMVMKHTDEGGITELIWFI